MATDTRGTLDLRRNTAKLVIDHYTVHPALKKASVHVLEKDTEGKTLGGQDVDGVDAAEMGVTGALTDGITESKLVSFVSGIADGVPVEMDKPAPPPETEE